MPSMPRRLLVPITMVLPAEIRRFNAAIVLGGTASLTVKPGTKMTSYSMPLSARICLSWRISLGNPARTHAVQIPSVAILVPEIMSISRE